MPTLKGAAEYMAAAAAATVVGVALAALAYRGLTGVYYYTPSSAELALWAVMLAAESAVMLVIAWSVRRTGRRALATGVTTGAILAPIVSALVMFLYLALNH